MPPHASSPAPRPLLQLVRNNVFGLIALAFVVAPSSYALAADGGSTEAKTTRICITKHSMLRYVASPGLCRAGEKSFFVSRRGVQGLRGVRGDVGPAGPAGPTGAVGATGPAGADGVPGPQGSSGVAAPLAFAEYFAPGDNWLWVQAGSDLEFPQDGPSQGTITRAGSASFTLAAPGVYRVAFSMPVDRDAQVQLTLDGVAVPYAAFGTWTYGAIAGETFVTTSAANSILSVRNSGNDFYVPSLNGGNNPVATHLTIQQLS